MNILVTAEVKKSWFMVTTKVTSYRQKNSDWWSVSHLAFYKVASAVCGTHERADHKSEGGKTTITGNVTTLHLPYKFNVWANILCLVHKCYKKSGIYLPYASCLVYSDPEYEGNVLRHRAEVRTAGRVTGSLPRLTLSVPSLKDNSKRKAVIRNETSLKTGLSLLVTQLWGSFSLFRRQTLERLTTWHP
jgi:hypothetical protein